MKFGIVFSTYRRARTMLKTLEYFQQHTICDRAVVIAVDDMTTEEFNFLSESPAVKQEKYIRIVGTFARVGIANNKNAGLQDLLQMGDFEHLIFMEDDVRPKRAEWEKVLFETAMWSGQKHLLYCPGRSRYGITKRTEGQLHRQVEWKQNCSGMLMYFNRKFLEQIGGFHPDFGIHGWEHNHLSGKALVAQGIEPKYYPHCAELERGGYIEADDMITKHTYTQGVERARFAQANEALYRRLMDEEMKKFYKGARVHCEREL